MDFRIKALSLRGSEATEAIHKTPKADSSMDRRALQSKARDDRESAEKTTREGA